MNSLNVSPSNFTNHSNTADESSHMPIIAKVIMTILYNAVVVIAIVGNGIVCWVLSHDMKGPRVVVTNLFLFNLSLADIILAALCIPITFINDMIIMKWIFGTPLCKLVNFAQGVAVLLSALTHVVISVDRFFVVYFPMQPRISLRQALHIIFCIWIVALASMTPLLIVNKVSNANCIEKWYSNSINDSTNNAFDNNAENDRRKLIYSMFLLVCQFLLPLLVISASYIAVAYRIWGRRTPGEQDIKRDKRILQSKRKMIRMMIVVVIVHAASWLPSHTVFIAGVINDSMWDQKFMPAVWIGCHFLAMSATCYNPFIYCWMNKGMRFRIINSCCLLRCCSQLARVKKNELHEHGMLSRASSVMKRSFTVRTPLHCSQHELEALEMTTLERNKISLRRMQFD